MLRRVIILHCNEHCSLKKETFLTARRILEEIFLSKKKRVETILRGAPGNAGKRHSQKKKKKGRGAI